MMGKKITYRELNALVNRFANALRDLGVKKGDKVALLLPNIPQGFIACLCGFPLGRRGGHEQPPVHRIGTGIPAQ